MDGSLRQVTAPAPPDQVKGKGTSSETSGITGVDSKDTVEHEEIMSPGLPVAESMSTEWTDEKHSLYLNFMETSFVRKLYSHEYCSVGLHSWRSKRKNQLDPSSLQQSNANVGVTSNQFKVLQSRCWRKRNFEKAQSLSDIANESRALVNPWIEHFKDVGKHQLPSPYVKVSGAPCTEATCLGCQSTSSKKHSACSSYLHQDSGFSFQEVSDQNFVNEENEGEQSSSRRRTKRKKTVASDVLDNDQVVPISKSFSTSEKCASPKRQQASTGRQSGNMGDITYLESGHPDSLDGVERTRRMDNS